MHDIERTNDAPPATPRHASDGGASTSQADSPPPPRRRGCGCWTLSFATLAAAILFVVGVYVVWRWSNARGVERMIAIAKEKGEPTTWEELSASYPNSPEIERTTELWTQAMDAARPPDLTTEDHYDVPIVGRSHPDDDEPWLFRERYQENRTITPRMLDASRKYLEKVGDTIELAHEARRSGAIARFPLLHEAEGAYTDEHLVWLRDVSNVVALDLELRRLQDPKPPLGEHHLTLVAVGESLRNEPRAMSQFVRTAVLGTANYHLLCSIEAEELTDEDLFALQAAWKPIDLRPAIRMVFEEAQLDAFLDLDAYVEPDAGVRLCPEEDLYLAASTLRAFLDADDDFGSVHATGRRVAPLVDNALESPFGQTRFAGTKNLLTSSISSIQALQDSQSRIDALKAILACERFRREDGDWPSELAELVPDWLDEVPRDSFTGNPMQYRRTDSGIVIYAVGADRNDDGGAVTWHGNFSDAGAKAELGKNVLRLTGED